MTRSTLAALAVAVFAIMGVIRSALLPAAPAPAAPVALEWPMSKAELIAFTGIQGRFAIVNEGIARVASGDQRLAQEIVEIALTAGAINHDVDEIVRDARISRKLPESIALVRSGVAWIETASR